MQSNKLLTRQQTMLRLATARIKLTGSGILFLSELCFRLSEHLVYSQCLHIVAVSFILLELTAVLPIIYNRCLSPFLDSVHARPYDTMPLLVTYDVRVRIMLDVNGLEYVFKCCVYCIYHVLAVFVRGPSLMCRGYMCHRGHCEFWCGVRRRFARSSTFNSSVLDIIPTDSSYAHDDTPSISQRFTTTVFPRCKVYLHIPGEHRRIPYGQVYAPDYLTPSFHTKTVLNIKGARCRFTIPILLLVLSHQRETPPVLVFLCSA